MGSDPPKLPALGKTAMEADRRHSLRFPLKFPVRLSWVDEKGKEHRARARAVDLSSSGIFIPLTKSLPVNQALRISVTWPVRDGGNSLDLICEGHVVRAVQRGRTKGVAAAIDKYSLAPKPKKTAKQRKR